MNHTVHHTSYCCKPHPLLQRCSRPCVTSPVVLEASSNVWITPPPPHSDIKQQLMVEEWSRFWKSLVVAFGIFWNAGVLSKHYQNYKCRPPQPASPVLKQQVRQRKRSREVSRELSNGSNTGKWIVKCVKCSVHVCWLSSYWPAPADQKNRITT
jgi:hypothetical protein